MKRKITFVAAAVICLCLAAGGTLAYFTAEGTARNVITTGSVKISLQEWTESDGQRRPFENVEGLCPGEDVSKIAEVKNTGDHPAWIRASVEVTEQAPVDIDFNTADWTFNGGFYYYNSVLEAGETTAPLFTTVHMDEKAGNEWKNKQFSINVNAYAAQSENNGSSALEASGWPEEE